MATTQQNFDSVSLRSNDGKWSGEFLASRLLSLFKKEAKGSGYNLTTPSEVCGQICERAQQRRAEFGKILRRRKQRMRAGFEPYETLVGFSTYSSGHMSYLEPGWFRNVKTGESYADSVLMYVTRREFAYLWSYISTLEWSNVWIRAFCEGISDFQNALWGSDFMISLIDAGFSWGEYSRYSVMNIPRRERNRRKTLARRLRKREYNAEMKEVTDYLRDADQGGRQMRILGIVPGRVRCSFRREPEGYELVSRRGLRCRSRACCPVCFCCSKHCECGYQKSPIREEKGEPQIDLNIKVDHDEIRKMLQNAGGSIGDAISKKMGTRTWKKLFIDMGLLFAGLYSSWGNKASCAIHIAQFVGALGLAPDVIDWLVCKISELCSRFVHIRANPSGPSLNPFDEDEGERDSLFEPVEQRDWYGRIRSYLEIPDEVANNPRYHVEERGSRQTADLGVDPSPIQMEHIGSLLGLGGGIATVVLAVMGTRSIPSSEKEMTAFIGRFSRLGMCCKSIETLFETGKTFTSWLTSLIRLYILGEDPRYIDKMYEVNAWCVEVSELVDSNWEVKVKNNMQLKTQVDSLLCRGTKLSRAMDARRAPLSERKTFDRLLGILTGFRGDVARSGTGQAKMRQVPLIVHLVGDTGNGKSSILWFMMYHICRKMGLKTQEEIDSSIFFRYATASADDWDGFSNNVKVVVVDDIFTQVDSATKPNPEVSETIRMGNNAYWPLSMAHMGDKGTTSFQAPLVFWTSNRSQFKFDSVTNAEAVINRVGLKYKVVPHPDFARRICIGGTMVVNLDKEKVKADLHLNPGNVTKYSRFVRLDPKSTTDPLDQTDTLSYEEVVAEIWAAVESNWEAFSDMLGALEKYLESMEVEEVGQVQGLFDLAPVVVRERLQPGIFQFTHLRSYLDWSYHVDIWKTFASILESAPLDSIDVPSSFRMLPGERTGFGSLYYSDCMVSRKKLNMADICAVLRCRCAAGGEDEFLTLLTFMGYSGVVSSCGHAHCTTVDKEAVQASLPAAVACFESGRNTQEFNLQLQKFAEVEKFSREIKSVIGMIVTGLLMAVGYRFFGGGSDVVAQGESRSDSSSGRVVTRFESRHPLAAGRRTARVESRSNPVGGRPVVQFESSELVGQAQMVLDQNANEIGGIAAGNLYKLEKEVEPGVWRHAMNILFIEGRIAICNRHLVVDLARGHPQTKWRIRGKLVPAPVEIRQHELNYWYPDSGIDYEKDVMVVEFPRRVRPHRNIKEKFMTSEDHGRFRTLGQVCLTGYDTGDNVHLRHYYTNVIFADDRRFVLSDGVTDYAYVRDYFKYGIQTQKGDCGAILVCYDKNFNRKLMGIHAAGIDNKLYQGIAQPITQSVLERLLAGLVLVDRSSTVSLDFVVDQPVVMRDVDGCIDFEIPTEGHCEIGTMQKGVHMNGQTRIFPSPIYGLLTIPKTGPARLSKFSADGEVVCPMELARAKTKPKPIVLLDCRALEAATNDVDQMIRVGVMADDTRVLSWEEAIRGVVGNAYYPPLNRKTSPGYGWPRIGIGKTEYFGSDEHYVFDHPDVVQARDVALERMSQGLRMNAVFEDTLKDERRPLARVVSGRTRLFSAGEQVFTVLFRQYFGGFSAHLIRNKIDMEACVGVNEYGPDWQRVAQRIRRKGPKVFAGDFSNYDCTLHPDFMWAFYDLADLFYAHYERDDASSWIRLMLFIEVLFSLHINGNRICVWCGGNPSGCPITTLLNCLVHCLMARYVFLRLAERFESALATCLAYNHHVSHINYGDDDVYNISDEVCEWFNQVYVTEEFAKFGMTYTDESKGGVVAPYRALSEINFLKRSFRFDEERGVYVAPLSMDTILESPMWVHGTVDVYELAADNLKDQALELSIHGEEVFKQHLPAFLEAARVLSERVDCRISTFYEYQTMTLGRQIGMRWL